MGLLLIQRLLDHFEGNLSIDVFEREATVGAGMPYSQLGAADEHIANVSANELPAVLRSIETWVNKQEKTMLDRFSVSAEEFNAYKALPRLFLGSYLSDEFARLAHRCAAKGFDIKIHYQCEVIDIIDLPASSSVTIVHTNGRTIVDKAIICSGHFWPKHNEGRVEGYFDSPYPPAKLNGKNNYAIAIRGASLTAIDAVRTLARNNGYFYETTAGSIAYRRNPDSEEFRLVMHARNGLLPAVRFHLEDAQLGRGELLSMEEIEQIKSENEGFIPLDYLYEHVFLDRINKYGSAMKDTVNALTMEEFVEKMMEYREDIDPFELLEQEYREAARSIRNRTSIYWKEMLAVLSYTMNYPAKYFSAEDMLRLQKTLKPLISIVIAFVPQQSVEELLALHQAGVLSLQEVGEESKVEPLETGGVRYHYTDQSGQQVSDRYTMFVDCVGQPMLSMSDLPFESLKKSETVAPAMVKFRSQLNGAEAYANGIKGVGKGQDGNFYMQLPGLAINDYFQLTDVYGRVNERLYMLAVPFIGGFNPDYSGLDFTEEASMRVVEALGMQI
ncbi:hypothetical protein GCM10017764_19190 [Sphingobacterium griseoflavum]|uniref:FAD-dependent urate hydroxylase HpyO/Asp monooxygenase CreE-like FAD/NAD(P)-binding domain-containing protein n=2 Tax=Sphingobacterium griseoflavum TaxID=1474952 RepID=A0ABQ3HUL9_9SPHI|nr:hypothetical protein GCM10017764_19190 [Sphingobacterium griseoflavum]